MQQPSVRAVPADRPSAGPLRGVVALVLAAGGSRRFGTANKLLHRWRDATLLEHVLDALERASLERTVVVTGHDRDAIEAVLTQRCVPPATIHNAAWRDGLASSLACGIGALIDSPAVLVCPGDMPMLEPSVIGMLLEAAHAAPDKAMARPVSGDRPGHPVLIRRVLFDQVRALEGDAGARVIAERQPDSLLEVAVDAVDAQGVWMDVDTAQDAAALAHFEPHGGRASAGQRRCT